MRIADKWQDYKLIDATCGERLENWNGVILIRPDPQVIWKTPRKTDLWDKADGHYTRSQAGGGSWSFSRGLPESWLMNYGTMKFKVRPTGFKHTGLFPEQAVNWDFSIGKLRGAQSKANVLNLFAYTGGATLACASAGASVCHCDAAKGMVSWARENAASSDLSDSAIRWIVDDCEKFTAREIRRERRYDAVIMDPPSYGRGPGGEVWKLEDNVFDLIKLSSEVLSDKPLFFMINSYTAGLSPSVMGHILREVICPKFGGTVLADEIGLPIETGGVLPCGATAIWASE